MWFARQWAQRPHPALLYPDIAARGSLATALKAKAEACLEAVPVTSPDFDSLLHATLASSLSHHEPLHISASSRERRWSIRGEEPFQNLTLIDGRTDDLAEVARAAHAWYTGASLTDIRRATPFVHLTGRFEPQRRGRAVSRSVLPTGPVLTVPFLAGLALVGGRYLQATYLRPLPWADRRHFNDLGVLTGIYLITDIDRRLRWLGQASRLNGLTGRLDGHDRDPAKRAVFACVRVLHLDDLTPTEALDAIEGRCTDLLGIRQSMKPRPWPPATNWLSLVA